jgi:hypothetical protein
MSGNFANSEISDSLSLSLAMPLRQLAADTFIIGTDQKNADFLRTNDPIRCHHFRISACARRRASSLGAASRVGGRAKIRPKTRFPDRDVRSYRLCLVQHKAKQFRGGQRSRPCRIYVRFRRDCREHGTYFRPERRLRSMSSTPKSE